MTLWCGRGAGHGNDRAREADLRGTIAPDAGGLEITTDAAVKRTTAEGCRILPDLILTHQPNVVFLLLGGNDADLDWRGLS